MSEDIKDDVVAEVETQEVEKPEVSEVEQKAIKMGWTPKDQFKGDPDKWRSAEEFVERGENMLPIVKAQVKRQEKEIAELKETMRQFGEYHTKTEQRAYERALNDLREQRAKAIAAGDGAEFDRVDTEIEKLRKQLEQENTREVQHEDATKDPVYVEWKNQNKWIEDEELGEYATSIGQSLRDAGVKTTGRDFLDMVSAKMKLAFPEKFKNPRRESAPSVEGGTPAPRRGGKSYADLPADAKAACDRMARNAYGDDKKMMDQFKAEYVKNFDWS